MVLGERRYSNLEIRHLREALGAGFAVATHALLRILPAAAVARVAEPADAYGSGPYGATRGGSSPLASN